MYRPEELDVFIYLRKSRKDLEEEKKQWNTDNIMIHLNVIELSY